MSAAEELRRLLAEAEEPAESGGGRRWDEACRDVEEWFWDNRFALADLIEAAEEVCKSDSRYVNNRRRFIVDLAALNAALAGLRDGHGD